MRARWFGCQEVDVSRLIVGLELRDKLVVVIGGGAVAARKCARFVEAGASIKVISPAPLHDALASLLDSHPIEWVARPYQYGDLAGAWVAVDASGDVSARADISAEADAERVLLNAASGGRGSLTLCATRCSGDVRVAVDTGGRSPALASMLADALVARVGREWGRAAKILGALRPLLRQSELTQRERAALSRALARELTQRAGGEAEVFERLRVIMDEHGAVISDDELQAITSQVEPD